MPITKAPAVRNTTGSHLHGISGMGFWSFDPAADKKGKLSVGWT